MAPYPDLSSSNIVIYFFSWFDICMTVQLMCIGSWTELVVSSYKVQVGLDWGWVTWPSDII